MTDEVDSTLRRSKSSSNFPLSRYRTLVLVYSCNCFKLAMFVCTVHGQMPEMCACVGGGGGGGWEVDEGAYE